jgi:hypothetical protein
MSTLSHDGFLADQTKAVIEEVRHQYGPWLSELRALNRILVRKQFELNVQNTNAQQVACAGLFVRSLAHAQAAIILLERGLKPSGRAMARCALEGTFKLVACARDYQTAVEFFEQIYVNGQRTAKYLAKITDPHTRAGVDEEMRVRMLEGTQAKIQELGASEIKARDMATRADLLDMYLTAYSFLSGAVHSSPEDIFEQFVLDGEGTIVSAITGPDTDKLGLLFMALGETMGLMANPLVTVFGLADDGECEKRVLALQALAHGGVGPQP